MAKTRIDLDLNFTRNPLTDDVSKLSGINAVERSLRNLFFMNRFEKPFHPEIYTGLRNFLFENKTPFLETDITERIRSVAQVYEPRVKIQQVFVTSETDNNSLDIKIYYSIPPENATRQFTVNLERLR